MKATNDHTDYTLKIPLFLLAVLLFLGSCGSSKPYTLGPIKTFDPDTSRIPQPEEKEPYQYWDRIDNTVFHQLEKPLDLNRTLRFTGQVMGVSDAKPADNINHLDEVTESSWYNYRHYYDTLTTEELARGPNTVEPDTSGKWTIFSGKLEGANPGFFIEDKNGNRFLIKFDGPQYPELTTSAEVIGTKIFYAAGYNVLQATITYFEPGQVVIGEDVTVIDQGKERQMTREDYLSIVSDKPRNEQGKIRALASKFVDGTPVGPWTFEGTRSDDPNDRVAHEHRREIRGMRVLSSWLNDTDRRDANTMGVYTDNEYIKHYVTDFGNTLGANGSSIHTPIHGQAYMVDPRFMALNAVALGTNINSWETINAENFIPFPSVGYFRADIFKPGSWVSVHPMPAFENMTLRDAFWGAKLVSSFSNEDIRAIVETGQITNPKAEEYLVNVLIERRNKIGRHWFSRINPIDKFNSFVTDNEIILNFTDLGLKNSIFDSSQTFYEYSVSVVDGDAVLDTQTSESTRISIDRDMIPGQRSNDKVVVLEYEIITRRQANNVKEKRTQVYVALESSGPRVVGIQREE